jgi:hypothetical protein
MLPANWITAAASHSGPILPVVAPSIHNDAAWLSIASPEEMFGSFPPSEVLFTIATRRFAVPTDSYYVNNARETIAILAKYARQLIEQRKDGVEAMIREGAECIAQSDTLYFGGGARRRHVIPIMVENPTRHELEEGKGIMIAGRSDISNETAAAVRRTVYQRRLQDGDIAIERYDISNRAECARAIHVLEDLIPKGSPGAKVWLWATGRLRSDRTLEGEDASAHIEQFRHKVAAANIEESRLRYVSKPSVQLKNGKKAKESLDNALKRFHQLRLPVSINITSEQLKRILESE